MSTWCSHQLSFWKYCLDACLNPWVKGKCLGSLRYLYDTGGANLMTGLPQIWCVGLAIWALSLESMNNLVQKKIRVV